MQHARLCAYMRHVACRMPTESATAVGAAMAVESSRNSAVAAKMDALRAEFFWQAPAKEPPWAPARQRPPREQQGKQP